ncbi:MAG: DUF6088 family protein [Chloroflexota bacterium]
MSTSAVVNDVIDKSPAGSFLRPGDISDAPRTAVHMALSRAARHRSDLVRVAPGVYWKGHPSRFGRGFPDAVAVARWRAGDRGVGPTGWLAANELGLSTQVPAHPTLTTVGRPPKGIRHVTFAQRANLARVDLNYLDIALLEVLRSYPDYVDVSWSQLVDRITDLATRGAIRLDAVARAAATERSASLSANLQRLLAALPA